MVEDLVADDRVGGEDDQAAAFDAGCDMVLVCNAPADAKALLEGLGPHPMDQKRARSMGGDTSCCNPASYQAARTMVAASFK